MDEQVIQGRVRRSAYMRVGRGLYRLRESDDQWLADVRAWHTVLPEQAYFTHLTGARLLGLPVPFLPSGAPMWVGMPKDGGRLRRPQLSVLRLTGPVATERVRGLPVATAAETVLAAARDLNLLDVTVLVDALLHRDPEARAELELLGERRQWGASTLRRALTWADGRAESPWETALRLLHVSCGIAVEPQFVVTDAEGCFLARADLRLSGTRTLHEYDGAGHRDRDTHRADLGRERRLANDRWTRRGYTSVDLVQRPHLILREADADLGRRHDPQRLDRWHRLIRGSLLTADGQDRFRARLSR